MVTVELLNAPMWFPEGLRPLAEVAVEEAARRSGRAETSTIDAEDAFGLAGHETVPCLCPLPNLIQSHALHIFAP